MSHDSQYWDKFYLTDKLGVEMSTPSSFAVHTVNYMARFILNPYIRPYDLKILDVGCGNGRDTFFFAENGFNVYAIDYSYNAVGLINDHILKNQTHNIKAFKQDFTQINNHTLQNTKFDVVYSRFTLHSVPHEGELRFINWAYRHMTRNGRLFIEVRSTKDKMCGVGDKVIDEENAWSNTHYRRFHDLDTLLDDLQNHGFQIINYTENNGVSKVGDDDPTVIRVIAKLNHQFK